MYAKPGVAQFDLDEPGETFRWSASVHDRTLKPNCIEAERAIAWHARNGLSAAAPRARETTPRNGARIEDSKTGRYRSPCRKASREPAIAATASVRGLSRLPSWSAAAAD